MVLLLCLIFLTALTLLGLSASAEAILQNQLAANLQETERAKQSALAALDWAESWLLTTDVPTPEICSSDCAGLKVHAPGDLPANLESESLPWWLDHGYEAGTDPLTGERLSVITGSSIVPPVWLIEFVHEVPPADDGSTDLRVWYRVLARGNGRTDTGISVVESIVVRSWSDDDSYVQPDTGAATPCPGSRSSAQCGRVAWRELR